MSSRAGGQCRKASDRSPGPHCGRRGRGRGRRRRRRRRRGRGRARAGARAGRGKEDDDIVTSPAAIVGRSIDFRGQTATRPRAKTKAAALQPPVGPAEQVGPGVRVRVRPRVRAFELGCGSSFGATFLGCSQFRRHCVGWRRSPTRPPEASPSLFVCPPGGGCVGRAERVAPADRWLAPTMAA